jgi:D-arabinan exo alpha-(1,3)/(1,5)-arabinofuranosidase (non-reducing end)
VGSNDDSKRIMPGETLDLADLTGPGVVTHIWVTVADNEYAWPRLLRLRVYYDGHKTPSVDSPIGDFFGVGHGYESELDSMMVRDASFGRAKNSYWPMPFRKSCRITVTNEGDRFVLAFYYQVDYRRYASLPADIGYFHAYYRQERPAVPGRNYTFLNIRGTGHYVGTVMSVIQTEDSWFGEGDDLFYVDGAAYPEIYGTGSEDYFNDGWGLRTSSGPWTGTPVAEGELVGSRLTGYRWHVPDPIPFTKSLWAGIEHAGWTSNPDGSVRSAFEERPDYFSSVAFWYQAGVNEDLEELPYGEARLPFGNAEQIAVEDSLADVVTEKGKASVQQRVFWGKDLLFFEGEGAGSRITIPFNIERAGRYEIVAELAEAPDYGNYYALIDGHPTDVDTRQPATSEIPPPGPEVLQNYLQEVYVATDHPLGWHHLAAGRHTVTFVCVGKDARSAGYNFGINDLVLEKVPESAGEPESPGPHPSAPPPLKTTAPAPPGVPVYRGLTLAAYRARLRHTSPDERAEVIRALGSFGADAAPALGEITEALGDRSAAVRLAAAWALSQIRAAGASAVPKLTNALSDSSPQVRSLAAIALRTMGSKAAPAAPALTRAVDDPVVYVRASAADALGAIGPAARAAVPILARRLQAKDEEMAVLRSIATALGNIGPAARDALPALQQAAKTVRLGPTAEEAILKIEGRPVPVWWPEP